MMINKLKTITFIIGLLSTPFSLSVAAIYQVTTATFAGVGSINQAVIDANANPGKDTIYFSIPGAGPHTILLGSELLFLQDIHIDGRTQTGFNPLLPVPVIELRNSPAMGIFINSGGAATGSEIIGLAVNNCAAAGILLNAPNNKVFGCYIGLGLNGNSDQGNNAAGIEITPVSSTGNIIGGTTLIDKNVISGNNGHGIIMSLSSGNYIIGNIIGANVLGTTAIPNGANGIQLSNNSTNNKIGGSTLDSSNLISGNNQHGIEMNLSNNNKILGNIIGLQSDRATALGNIGHGIFVFDANFNQIGGIGSSTGNIISSNGSIGINILNSRNTIIKSNIIGTSGNSQLARGNQSNNIQLQNSIETVIGGNKNTEGNVISASATGAGINIDPGCNNTIVKGNYIGTDKTGTLALGNLVIGIILKSDNCTIGEVTNNEGNIIVDTRIFSGILIADANNNTVRGNLIGASADTTALPNTTDGINISVESVGQTTSNNIVQYNVIAFNTIHGINVGRALNNFINNQENNNDLRFNSIFCNQQQGISLNLTNNNDRGNNGKIAPAINTALSNANELIGLANGLQPTDLVDIYEMSECMNCDINPQGKKYIATVSPDANGNWSYIPGTPLTGTLIATATDVNRNTSQFSLCFTPCDATAKINQEDLNIMLTSTNSQTITLESLSSFSVLNPEPGNLYWSLSTADTTGSALYSKNASINLEIRAGLYNVFLIAKQSGCLDTTMVTINAFFIPNLITPNGDFKNDSWAVGNAPGQFDAKIYNRWGDLVFFKTDYTNEWDAAGLSEGVYYYHLEDKINPDKSYKGWLQVIK